MIVPGVDIDKKEIWFNRGPQIEILSQLNFPKPTSKPAPVYSATNPPPSRNDVPFEISILINPPLLNSQINAANPRTPPKPFGPRPSTPVNNPMFYFGSSLLTVGFGISLIPGLTEAAQALGIIEDPDSFESQMATTL
jgi:hypothetical protein